MTEEVHSRPLPPPGAPAAAAAGPSVMDRVDRVLDTLWHFVSSMRVAMVIMLLIAALGVVGSLLIQAPTGVLGDPQAKAAWLDEVRPKYGGWTGIMNTLQLFEIFNSLVFRVLVAGLMVSLIACSIHRIPGTWRTTTRPRVDVGRQFFAHAPQHEAIVVRHTPAETRTILESLLRQGRYRVLAADSDTIQLYADRFRWAPWAGIIGHLSLVVILIGAILGSVPGIAYRDSQFTIAEGQTLPVAAEPGVTIQLLDFTDAYDTRTGAPIDYASQVVLYRGGQEVERHTIRVNDPMQYGNTTFYQAFFGEAAVMTVRDAAGNVLVSEGVPLAWRTTADNRPIGSFSIPGTGYVGWVVGTLGNGDSTVQPGQAKVELYTTGEGTLVDSRVVDQGKSATLANLTITFEREAQFTGLNIARDPGVVFVWLGSLLLFLGFVIRFMVPHKRVWARIVARPSGGAVLGVASLGIRNAADPGADFDHLVNDIRAALQAPAKA